MDAAARYAAAEALATTPGEAAARALIPMLTDDAKVMIDEGMSVYDVDPTYSTVAAAARTSLVQMLRLVWPTFIDAFRSAPPATVHALFSILSGVPMAERLALPDDAHAVLVEAAQHHAPYRLDAAVFERLAAQRKRAGELEDPETFWRHWLAHPTLAYEAIYKLAKIVEDKAAFVREMVPLLGNSCTVGAATSMLETFPRLLPPETVRELAASELPRKNEALIPLLAEHGEPAAALAPLCIELLQNEPLREHEPWERPMNERELRWYRATSALEHLADALPPEHVATLEPRLMEMAASPGSRADCAKRIRDALAARGGTVA